MFNSYEFTFAGKPSAMYGVMLYEIGGKGQSDVSFGNKAKIVETRTTRRIQPIHYGVNYNESPLQFKLVFGSETPLDRWRMMEIAYWLTGHQDYQWLTIEQPDMFGIQYRCLITELTPISYGWLPYAFEATVTCDCPYAYSAPFEKTYTISDNTSITIRNEGSVHEAIKPILVYSPSDGATSGLSDLKIMNKNDGDRTFWLKDLPSGTGEITVDCNNGIIEEENGENLYGHFNDKAVRFIRLVPGVNNLEVTGNGTLTIRWRLLYNVAG